MNRRTEELTAILALAASNLAKISTVPELEASAATRVVTHQIFEKLANVLDQAFLPVWLEHVGRHLAAKQRARVQKHVGLPACESTEQLRSRLGQMKALEVYDQGQEFQRFVDRFQAIDQRDVTFSVVRAVANRKHEDTGHQVRTSEPALMIGGIPPPWHVAIRRLKVDYRYVDTVLELRVTVDGGSFNVVTNKYGLPLPPHFVRIENVVDYVLDGVAGGAVAFLSNAIARLRNSLAEFQRVAGGSW